MTAKPPVKRSLVFFLVKDFTMVAFATALEPLRIANRMLGYEAYQWRLASVDGKPVAASNGVLCAVNTSLDEERRKLDDAGLAAVADGRVFTGRQGVELKLVDRIGGEREAIAWLETEKGVAKGLKVRDWTKARKIDTFGILGGLAEAAGLREVAQTLGAVNRAAQARLLDGLLAIWQGSALN